MEIHITFIHCILADNLAGVRRQAMCGPIGWWPTDVARSSTILQSMVQFRNTRPKLRCITGSVYLQRLDNPKCRRFNGIGVCAICVGVGYMSRAKFRKERRRGAEREIREWGHWTARIEGFMSCRSVCMSSTFDYIHYNTSSVFIERAACTISISTCLTTAQSSREWKRERYRCAPIHSFTFSAVKLVYTHSHIIICPRSATHAHTLHAHPLHTAHTHCI